jgi:N-acetylglucosamine kinase-like BadF-type ATPase
MLQRVNSVVAEFPPALPRIMQLYLGIDGGGTRTRAILVDSQGRVVGEGEAGPSNYNNVGLAAAGRALRAAAESAWARAGKPRTATTPASAFLGLAGVKASVDVARLTSLAESAGLAPAGQVTVANDLHNALAGGLAGRPGIALIAGTGTNCLGRDATGATFMCGGWGWLLDDVGGGIGLALAGLRAATRAADGRSSAIGLLPRALAFFGLTDANELLERLYARACRPSQASPLPKTTGRSLANADNGMAPEFRRLPAGIVEEPSACR